MQFQFHTIHSIYYKYLYYIFICLAFLYTCDQDCVYNRVNLCSIPVQDTPVTLPKLLEHQISLHC